MSRAVRTHALVLGAAALLSAQPVLAAAPAKTTQATDPLVTLSILGTPQSRAAVTAGGAVTAAQGVPVVAPPPPPPLLANEYPPRANAYVMPGAFALIVGLIGLIAILAFIDFDEDRDFTPVSPS